MDVTGPGPDPGRLLNLRAGQIPHKNFQSSINEIIVPKVGRSFLINPSARYIAGPPPGRTKDDLTYW